MNWKKKKKSLPIVLSARPKIDNLINSFINWWNNKLFIHCTGDWWTLFWEKYFVIVYREISNRKICYHKQQASLDDSIYIELLKNIGFSNWNTHAQHTLSTERINFPTSVDMFQWMVFVIISYYLHALTSIDLIWFPWCVRSFTSVRKLIWDMYCVRTTRLLDEVFVYLLRCRMSFTSNPMVDCKHRTYIAFWKEKKISNQKTKIKYVLYLYYYMVNLINT